MAQAQMAVETRRAPSRVWARISALAERIKARREQRRALVKLLAEWDRGIATGARGLTLGPDPQA